MPSRLILSLCDFSGEWSRPYLQRGYEVVMVDKGHPPGERRHPDGSWRIGADVTQLVFAERPYGVLAAPPCTCFCRPAARWWARQDAAGETERDVAVMRACLRLCKTATGWWALENPPGRHRDLIEELGKPAWQYQPWEYGDPWGKQTYIWGTARKPRVLSPVAPAPTRRTPNGKTQGRIAFMSSSHKRQREQTPAGFAKAFRLANP
jgi:hypothetical protein